MTNYFSMPEFDDIADVFWRLGILKSPSELQGRLTGQLVLGATPTAEQWLQQAQDFLDPVADFNERDSTWLLDLHNATCSQLSADEYDFKMLLPDEKVDIRQRVESLGLWCHGFLVGFAMAGKERQQKNGSQQYSIQISEVLSDIAAISQVGIEGEDTGFEQSEHDYFQLSEYLRIAAITIYFECVHDETDTLPENDAAPSVNRVANLFSNKPLH